MKSNDSGVEPVWVWDLPLAPITLSETVESVAGLIDRGVPSFFVTANTHYAMLTSQYPDLEPINSRAAFILADGKPLVWASRNYPVRVPERVAGSDLIFALSQLAARKNYRIFLAGAPTGVADEAARQLMMRYPGLQVVGTASPKFRDMSIEEYDKLKSHIHSARPHLLILAASQPHGERWLFAHYEELGVPVSANLGASIDFAAKRIRRAPRWMQKSGLEWAFRLMMEPRRLLSRYSRNARFLLWRIGEELRPSGRGSRSRRQGPELVKDSLRKPR